MDADLETGSPAEFFVADLEGVSPKSDIYTLELPFFSLSKRPIREVQVYDHNGVRVEIIPSAKGLPTIWDRGILIYAAAHLVRGIDLGRLPSRVLAITPYDLLKTTNGRGWCGGSDYRGLIDALDRLCGATIKTTVATGGQRTTHGFGLIEKYCFIDRRDRAGSLSITLCDWLYRAIVDKKVLTLDREYFLLSGALERRLYEIVRKQLGTKLRWSIDIDHLHTKTGSRSEPRRFRFELRRLINASLPMPLDRYLLAIDGNRLLMYPNAEMGRKARLEDVFKAQRSRKPVSPTEVRPTRPLLLAESVSSLVARVNGNAPLVSDAGDKL